jgi:hypothetical protein
MAETFAISQEKVASIIHEILDTRSLSAKFVSKCLNAVQKRDKVHGLQAILDRFRRDPEEFLTVP